MKRFPIILLSALLAACSGENASDPVTEPVVAPDPVEKPAEEGLMCTDSPLLLELPSVPELGSAGSIKVYDSSDRQVDEINLADLQTVTIREDGQMIPKAQITKESIYNTFMDAVKCSNRWRIIHYTPLRVKGKALEIKLHSGVLDFGKEYYVTMDKDFVKGHGGIAKGEWSFKTKSKPSSKSELKVNADGSADFCTVQGAVSYSATLGKTAVVEIVIASGTYNETVFIRDKNSLTLKGENRANTVISYANNESYANGSGASIGTKPSVGRAIGACGGRGVILAEACDGLVIENLSLKNGFGELKGQAEVLYFNGNGKLFIENCSLNSLQDTFLCKGQVYVHNSLISGHCDFIWGYPKACLFEDCEIRSEAAGYIVQARVQNKADKGFVFLNCRLTAAEGVKDGTMYLARSGGSSDYYDNVTFIGCTMSPVIAASGWYTNPAPNPSSPGAESGWKEYGSKDASGKALDLGSRSRMSRILTESEAAAYSGRAEVLGY